MLHSTCQKVEQEICLPLQLGILRPTLYPLIDALVVFTLVLTERGQGLLECTWQLTFSLQISIYFS